VTVPLRATAPLIRLDEFEGPLDLLLQLVERRRLPIAELSLVAVAEQYLDQVQALEAVQPDVLSEFLAMAARLLLLKSRALLPAIAPPEADGDDEPESAEELLRRLEAYRAFKEVAEELRRLDAEGGGAYARGAQAPAENALPAPLQAIAPALLASLMAAIERRQTGGPAEEVAAPIRASVEERQRLLRSLLGTRRAIAWDDVAGTTVDEIVATLLAVLEMVRRGELAIVQGVLFGPIRLEAVDHRTVAAGSGAGG
jgi:segregation and condensation protein A